LRDGKLGQVTSFTIVCSNAKQCVDEYMVLFSYCLLRGNTAMLGGLHARLCHAFLVNYICAVKRTIPSSSLVAAAEANKLLLNKLLFTSLQINYKPISAAYSQAKLTNSFLINTTRPLSLRLYQLHSVLQQAR